LLLAARWAVVVLVVMVVRGGRSEPAGREEQELEREVGFCLHDLGEFGGWLVYLLFCPSVCLSTCVREEGKEDRFLNLLVCLSVTNRGWSGEEWRGEERRGEDGTARWQRGFAEGHGLSPLPFPFTRFYIFFLFVLLCLFGCLPCSNLSLGQAASQRRSVYVFHFIIMDH